MKVVVKRWHAVAQWRWDTGNPEQEEDSEGDVCGICRVPFEGCCPSCKMPGDDCPLSTFYSFLKIHTVFRKQCLLHKANLFDLKLYIIIF